MHKSVITLVLGVILASPPAAHAGPEKELWNVFGAQTRGDYRAPDAGSVALVGSLFNETVKNGLTDDLVQRWLGAGFTLSERRDKTLLLKNAAAKADGRGVYLINRDARHRVMVQAPHRFYDRLTGRLAFRLFHDGGLMAAGWNTLHRHSGVGADREAADLARAAGSYWMGVSDAFLSSHVDAMVLQIHGFNPQSREEPSARSADMIVSSGTRPASKLAGDFAACLKQKWPGNVLLYPRDTGELGGTRNPLSKLEQNTGRHRFVHLELSPAARRRLMDERPMRLIIRDCLP